MRASSHPFLRGKRRESQNSSSDDSSWCQSRLLLNSASKFPIHFNHSFNPKVLILKKSILPSQNSASQGFKIKYTVSTRLGKPIYSDLVDIIGVQDVSSCPLIADFINSRAFQARVSTCLSERCSTKVCTTLLLYNIYTTFIPKQMVIVAFVTFANGNALVSC